jgi:hypothetical protein
MSDIESNVLAWLKEFEEEDAKMAKLYGEKKVRPKFDFQHNDYLARYILHCPAFYELYISGTDYAIEILWEFKDHQRPLSKRGLEGVYTYHNCVGCKGRCGKKACEVFK